ncbi:26287_t:CDS:2, partial [Dentiscutata erythropus]
MKHSNNSITSFSKGDGFEIKVFRLVKNKIKIDCQRVRLSRGDGGIDMLGNYNHYLLLFQCKDLTNKVEVDYIRDFESVISRFNKQTTIGIYVTSAKDGYSSGAMGRAKSSEYHLLLTNIHDLCQDIPEYLSKVLKDNSVREKIYRIEEKIDEIIEILERQEKFIHKIKNDRIKIENKQIK